MQRIDRYFKEKRARLNVIFPELVKIFKIACIVSMEYKIKFRISYFEYERLFRKAYLSKLIEKISVYMEEVKRYVDNLNTVVIQADFANLKEAQKKLEMLANSQVVSDEISEYTLNEVFVPFYNFQKTHIQPLLNDNDNLKSNYETFKNRLNELNETHHEIIANCRNCNDLIEKIKNQPHSSASLLEYFMYYSNKFTELICDISAFLRLMEHISSTEKVEMIDYLKANINLVETLVQSNTNEFTTAQNLKSLCIYHPELWDLLWNKILSSPFEFKRFVTQADSSISNFFIDLICMDYNVPTITWTIETQLVDRARKKCHNQLYQIFNFFISHPETLLFYNSKIITRPILMEWYQLYRLIPYDLRIQFINIFSPKIEKEIIKQVANKQTSLQDIQELSSLFACTIYVMPNPNERSINDCYFSNIDSSDTYSDDNSYIKSDKNHLYLYKEMTFDGRERLFYCVEEDEKKYYLIDANNNYLNFRNNINFNSIEINNEKIIREILEITTPRNHTLRDPFIAPIIDFLKLFFIKEITCIALIHSDFLKNFSIGFLQDFNQIFSHYLTLRECKAMRQTCLAASYFPIHRVSFFQPRLTTSISKEIFLKTEPKAQESDVEDVNEYDLNHYAYKGLDYNALCILGSKLGFDVVMNDSSENFYKIYTQFALCGNQNIFFNTLQYIKNFDNIYTLETAIDHIRCNNILEEVQNKDENPLVIIKFFEILEKLSVDQLDAYTNIHIFNISELTDYLNCIENSCQSEKVGMPMMLSSTEYSICIEYNFEEKCWYIIDIALFTENYCEKIWDATQLAYKIFQAFWHDQQNEHDFTAFKIEINCTDTLQECILELERCFPFNCDNRNRYTSRMENMLHLCCLFNQVEKAEILLSHLKNDEKYFDILNMQTINGLTPLALACQMSNIEIAKILISYEARTLIPDKEGFTPFANACRSGSVVVAQMFFHEMGWNYNYYGREFSSEDFLSDENGVNFLSLACRYGNYQIVKIFVNFLIFYNNLDYLSPKFDYPPLHEACRGNYLNIVKLLCKTKVPTLFKSDHNRNSPFMCACSYGNLEIAIFLFTNIPTMLEARNKDGCTALLLAAKYGHIEVVKFLIKENADCYATNMEGKTARDLALENGHFEIAELLVRPGIQDEFLQIDFNNEQIPENPEESVILKTVRKNF